jgi:hypothetical protein
MVRRKASPDADEPPKEPATPTSPTEGNGEKKLPAFKVGPIATDRTNAVVATVWEHEVQAGDGRTFKVHNVMVESRYFDANHENADGSKGLWKTGKSFRGSQLYALLYCVQRASDFILAQRDASNDCPF